MPLTASKAALAALVLCAAISLFSATIADAQGVSPNSNNQIWAKGATCVAGQSVGPCCCARRPRVVVSTKFTTKTAVKTVKRTRTVTRTVTSTVLNRRRMERDVVPEVAERSLPEPAVEEDKVDEAEVKDSLFEVAERAVTEEPEAADVEVEEYLSEAPGHELFARNLCPACPTGINPRLGTNNNGGSVNLCCPRSTRFTTRTKTTTRIKTTTVKTATRTVTTTTTQKAAVTIPVLVLSETVRRLAARKGAPVISVNVYLRGPNGSTNILGQCITGIGGTCNIYLPFLLNPGDVYEIFVERVESGATFFTAKADGQPPIGASGNIEVTITETNTVTIRRREIIGRRDADGRFRRALKALATPAPQAF